MQSEIFSGENPVVERPFWPILEPWFMTQINRNCWINYDLLLYSADNAENKMLNKFKCSKVISKKNKSPIWRIFKEIRWVIEGKNRGLTSLSPSTSPWRSSSQIVSNLLSTSAPFPSFKFHPWTRHKRYKPKNETKRFFISLFFKCYYTGLHRSLVCLSSISITIF